MSLRGINGTPKSQDLIPLSGGLDLVTPPIFVKPGRCSKAQNWEVDVNGGYTTIQGYERFDGQDKPSDAVYAILNVTITGEFSVGDEITGATSGATATVIAIDNTGDQDYLVITKITGSFNASEDLEVSASVEGNTDASQSLGSARSRLLDAQYKNLAADEYRGDISAVPGSGDVLHLEFLDDVLYAWRNNSGDTATDVYKSTSSGWTQVALGRELAFTSGGTTEITEGQTITGATSGATAVLTRVMLESGSWAGGDAAGKFIFASQTGTFQAENIDVGVSSNLATIAGDSSAITLTKDGDYESIVENFTGAAGTRRIYGCDGVNRGFEFDGSVYCPIDTGMGTDTPDHAGSLRNHLFFGFGASAQHSGVGTPYSWTIVTGASELALGDVITGFKEQPGAEGDGSLAIFMRNRLNILYGTSSADWVLVKYRDEVGAYSKTIQEFGVTLMLDDRGVDSLSTVQDFGNFQNNVLSNDILPWINERKNLSTGSCVSRDKSQYRLFFSDKYALYVTVKNRQVMGMMPAFFKHKVTCITSREDSSGNEVIFFGSDNGMVYQLDKGTSFDGDKIEDFIELHYLHSGSARIKKRYRSAALEISGEGYHELRFSYRLAYGDLSVAKPPSENLVTNFASVQWDSGYKWDSTFIWDSVSLSPSRVKLSGRAENISISLKSNSDYFSPVTVSSVQLRLSPGRDIR